MILFDFFGFWCICLKNEVISVVCCSVGIFFGEQCRDKVRGVELVVLMMWGFKGKILKGVCYDSIVVMIVDLKFFNLV